MSFTAVNPVNVGAATKKSDYDVVFANTLLLKTEISDLGIVQRAQAFRGLNLRTHPDADKAANQVSLLALDEIVMSDGARYSLLGSILPLAADITTSGAGGLDTGSRVASTWYEAYLIGKSSTKANADLRLLLHRAKNYSLDQSQLLIDAAQKLRDAGADTKIGQTFQVSTANLKCEFVDAVPVLVGAPTGRVWAEIQDNAGNVLATSDKLDVSGIQTSTVSFVRFIFRTPYAGFAAATTYRLAFAGDYTVNASNYVQFATKSTDVYASGTLQTNNGTTWANATGDMSFKIYLTANDLAVTMPGGYDQSCKVSYVFNNGSNVLAPFIARDRQVATDFNVVVSGFANTIPTLVDVSTSLPPVSALAEMTLQGTVAADEFLTACLPDGYTTGFTGAGRTITTTAPTTTFSAAPVRSVAIEYQALYFTRAGASSGSATLYANGYRW